MDEEDFTETTGAQQQTQGGQGGKKGKKNKKGGNQAATNVAEEDDAKAEADLELKKKQQAEMMKAMAGDEDDSDDDPVFGKKKNKKGGKGKGADKDQGGRGGGRGKKGGRNQKEEDTAPQTDATAEEESKDEQTRDSDATEETSKPVEEVSYPLEVYYCSRCGLPSEYCEFGNKNEALEECKKALLSGNPDLYEELYPDQPEEEEEGKEESKESAKPQKKKKKVGFASEADKKIRVIKLKRGGRKYVSSIVGLDKYGVDLAEAAKKLSKKIGAGAASILIEYKELSQMGVQVQGDVEERFEEFITEDLKEFKIPFEQVTFEDGGNKKNRTMGGGR